MADERHVAYSPAHWRHESVKSTDGGACLVRHETTYRVNDSCSYRWQALEKAKTGPGRSAYDAHSKAKCHIGAQNPGPVPAGTGGAGVAVIKTIKGKKPKNKGKKFDIINLENFTTGFVPYGNQAHHIVNNSSLQKAINELAETFSLIRWVIVGGLLTEKYNLNHKDNMLLLPTKNKDCRETGLPRHYGSHPNYSDEILVAVKRALQPYNEIADQMDQKLKNHDKPEPKKLKKALERISDTMYANLLAAAAANRTKKAAATVINSLPRTTYTGI